MKTLDKPKELNDSEFINKLQNGYRLLARYKYESNGKSYLLFYNLWRQRNTTYPYVLTIEESLEDFDPDLAVCSERDVKIEFISYEKAISYLKDKEKLKLTDWTFTSEGRKKFES